jgi:hypothetical protein
VLRFVASPASRCGGVRQIERCLAPLRLSKRAERPKG